MKDDWLVFSEHLAGSDSEYQRIANLSSSSGHCNSLRGFSELSLSELGEIFGSVVEGFSEHLFELI